MFKLQFKDNPGRSIWLVGEKVCLGSDRSNDLVLEGLGIGEFHAELYIHPHYLVLNSRAGSCYVNELPVDAEYQLAANDIIRMGKERLQIIDSSQLDAAKQTSIEKENEAETGWSLVCAHPKLQQRDFRISKNTVLGRSKDCTLSVPYKLLSREHASLRVESSHLLLVDLGSANGCFVNGDRVDQAKLKHGDTVSFAKLNFTVCGPAGEIEPLENSTGEDEMNKTMMRPAIDMDIVLQKSSEQSQRQASVSVEFTNKTSNGASAEVAITATTSKTKLRLVVIVSTMIIAASIGAYLYIL